MKILSIIVSLVMLISSTNLKLNFHLCHDQIAEINLWETPSNHCENSNDHACHAPTNKIEKSCCALTQEIPEDDNCCGDQSLELKIESDFTLSGSFEKIALFATTIVLNYSFFDLEPVENDFGFRAFTECHGPPIYLFTHSLIFYG